MIGAVRPITRGLIASMILTKCHVQKLLGEQLVLWIDPQKVDYHVGTKWPNIKHLTQKVSKIGRSVPYGRKPASLTNKLIFRCEPFTISQAYYREKTDIESLEKYRKVKDFIENRHRVEGTIWYGELMDELKRKGCASYKKKRLYSKEEIDSFFQSYVMDLVDSMEEEGYNISKSTETGVALIGSDGAVHKAGSGTHRFYVARILGVKAVPVKIAGVHKEWFDRQVGSRRRLDKLSRELKVVEACFS
jgi:hypothetical protein